MFSHLVMETNLLSCTFSLILLTSFLGNIHADSHNHQTQSPMDFLKPLIGSRKGNSIKGLSQLKKYLSNLGYMNPNNQKPQPVHSNDDSFDDNLEKAVRKYQTFFKLKVTGILDANTVALMLQPRCGVSDFTTVLFKGHSTPITSSSNYTFFPGTPKWPPTKRNLTYSFPKGTLIKTNKAILNVTNMWASVSPFKFIYIQDYDKADIKISFEYMDHGDGAPFDGPGGILAHAFAPTDGRLHFDGDERWVDGVRDGAYDLQTIGLHELGHILGLMHTPDWGAIMYPYVSSGLRKGLGQDDIDGIKALYP